MVATAERNATLAPLGAAIAILVSAAMVAPTVGASTQAEQSVRLQLPPRDEAKQVPGLEPFLTQLRSVVAKRDAKSLLAMVASDIVSDPFGPGVATGRAAFRTYWELDDPNSDFWSAVEGVLELGAPSMGAASLTTRASSLTRTGLREHRPTWTCSTTWWSEIATSRCTRSQVQGRASS